MTVRPGSPVRDSRVVRETDQPIAEVAADPNQPRRP